MNQIANFLWLASLQTLLFSVVLLAIVMVAKKLFRQRANGMIIFGFVAIIALWLVALVPLPSWSFAWLPAQPVEEAIVVASVETDSDRTNGSYLAEANQENVGSEIAESSNTPPHSMPSQFDNFIQMLQQVEEFASAPATTDSSSTSWKFWFAILALTGMLFGGLRLIFALISMNSIKRSGKRILDQELVETLEIVCAKLGFSHSIELRQTDETTAAFTVGWRRPIVFLSKDWKTWNQQQLTATLAHEIAHVSNGDFFQRIVAQISTVLNFFNPIVHLLCSQLNLEQELSADDRAAAVVGGRKSYLNLLAEMALKTEYPPGRLSPMFLPTRKTFFRRIEMLRQSSNPSGPTWDSGKRKWSTAISAMLICLIGIGVAGLRLPVATSGAQEVAARAHSVTPSNSQAATEANLRFVPSNPQLVTIIRANQILNSKIVKSIFTEFEIAGVEKPDLNEFQDHTGLTGDQMDQITFVASVKGPIDGFVLIVQTIEDGWWSDKSDQAKEFEKRLQAEISETFCGRRIFKGKAQRSLAQSFWHAADKKTLICSENLSTLKACLREPDGPRDCSWADKWNESHRKDLFSTYYGPEAIELAGSEFKNNPLVDVMSPLWEEPNYAIAGITFGDKTSVRALASCGTDDGATRVGDTVRGLIPLAKNFVRGNEQFESLPLEFSELVIELLDSATVETDKNQVSLSLKLETDPTILVKMLTPLLLKSRVAATRATSLNNMRQIGIGMHNYESAFQHLPPAVLTSPAGKEYSWRIAILPFIDHNALYEAYRFDEEWNSPHNSEITANIPLVLRHPDSKSPTACNYFVVTGKETMFPLDDSKMSFQNVSDGLSNTLMLVESKQDIHWAEPRDLDFGDEGLLDSLGGFEDGIFAGTFGDCSSRSISKWVGEEVLRELLTRAGGTVINHNQLNDKK